MEESMMKHLDNFGVKALRKSTEKTITHTVYDDRVRVKITKSIRKRMANRKLYSYYVHVYFVYEGKEVHTEHSYTGMKRAMKFATDIFRSRNKYMYK